jgi:hypothetical protein
MYGEEDTGKGEPTKTLFDLFLDRETTTRFESAGLSPLSALSALRSFLDIFRRLLPREAVIKS